MAVSEVAASILFQDSASDPLDFQLDPEDEVVKVSLGNLCFVQQVQVVNLVGLYDNILYMNGFRSYILI